MTQEQWVVSIAFWARYLLSLLSLRLTCACLKRSGLWLLWVLLILLPRTILLLHSKHGIACFVCTFLYKLKKLKYVRVSTLFAPGGNGLFSPSALHGKRKSVDELDHPASGVDFVEHLHCAKRFNAGADVVYVFLQSRDFVDLYWRSYS